MGKKAKSVVIFFVLLLIDQLTKLWAVKILKPIGSIKIIHNVLEIYYVENRGAAFGIMQNKQWFFLIITLARKTFCTTESLPVFCGGRSGW